MIPAVVDLSHYQTPNFSAMAAGGIDAVILKATQGTTFTDPAFVSYAAAAKAAGLLVGAYHFYDTTADPAAQAAYFLGVIKPTGISVLAIDFEPSPVPTTTGDQDAAAVMVQAVHASTGHYPLLYTGRWEILMEALPTTCWKAWRRSSGGRFSVAPTDAALLACPLWIADWTTAGAPEGLPPGWTTWEFWQFESSLNDVPGVTGACDRSNFNGALDDLETWWAAQAVPPVKPPPASTPVLKVTALQGEAQDAQGNQYKFNLRGVLPMLAALMLLGSVVGCLGGDAPRHEQIAATPNFWVEHPPSFYLDSNLQPRIR